MCDHMVTIMYTVQSLKGKKGPQDQKSQRKIKVKHKKKTEIDVKIEI